MNTAISLRATYNIVAMNLSLGDGGSNATQCAGSVFRNAVNSAFNAGILTVVAAGNSGSKTGLSDPACVANAVSVGAVYDASYGSFSWLASSAPGGVCTDTSAPDKVTCLLTERELPVATGSGLVRERAERGVSADGDVTGGASHSGCHRPCSVLAIRPSLSARPCSE